HEKDLITEGITYSPSLETFFVGSIYKRKIVAIDKRGDVRDFISNGQYGAKSFGGLKVDDRNSILWAVSGAWIFADGEKWKTALFKFNAKSGELLGKYPLADSVSGFNDLALKSDGSVYITDTGAGAIYCKSPGKDEVEIFMPKQTFNFPNGIVLEGESLFVADGDGISKVSLKTKQVTKLKSPEGVELGGIDGLSSFENDLIGVQNGVTPRQVIRIKRNTSKTEINEIQVLDVQDVPRKNFSPTTGVVVDSSFYFLSNSQVRSFDANRKIFPLDQLEPVYIKRIRLK
ncbi:unnamed protein product, partial [Phaeothamnion confervicola]